MTDLTPILAAVRQAAELCQTVQQEYLVKSDKGGKEPVTIADYGSQAIVCRTLQAHYPDDAVMSEESGSEFMSVLSDDQRAQIVVLIGQTIGEDVTEAQVKAWLDYGKGKDAPRTWVIDPIDGTKGFLGLRQYVVAVGILDDRQPTAGILAAPGFPDGPMLFYTQDGKAYMQNLDGSDTPKQITVSDRGEAGGLRTVESFEKGHAGFDRMAKVRELVGIDDEQVDRLDSQEKYARVALGMADLYLRLPSADSTRKHSIWDHAAGAALVAAAGGAVTDVDGSPLDYSQGNTLNNIGVIASNGKAHDKIVAAVQQVLNAE